MLTFYRVEVSGWDASENFFVEKTNLEWDEAFGRRVRLSHALKKGSVIFVRLMQSWEPVRSYPIPYHAEPANGPAETGFHEFRLVQLHPRADLKRPVSV